ncbi:MDR family MFS transporter [Nocardioides sp. Kera G14]|uniref:MDR family MFS transporter n=1 Tax=Nocardioides sp. Kera G14 TaxID=2884264 RepID=UPI001D130083|nr:MDR family MFS transporter [Nocardioides sp. Kera G14]UDY24501.1 MFS transporter [Nocardioides sp. Kera G14]
MATNSSTPVPASDSAQGEYTHRQILTILTGLLLGMFLGALDQSIVSTSIRTIADDLHGLNIQAWVTTAYLITSTITTPIYGKLGDLWGRKKLFMFAITVFIVGSLLCTIATSMYELAAFRAFQGLGAGGLFTLVLAIVGDIVSPRERAKYTGYFMATFGSSSVLGPVIGGLLAGANSILGIAGWRWVFLVNVPIGILALVVVYRTLHVHHVKREAKIDWMGGVALVICLVPLLTVAEQGQDWGWGSGRALLCFIVGAVGLVLFIAAEAFMGRDALIPLSLFKIRAAAVTVVASVLVGMGLFGGMMMLPLYMQIVHGASPTQSGLLMLPMVVGLMSAAMISGRITSKTGRPRIFPIIGSLFMALGMFLLTTISADTHLWVVMLFMLIVGYGVGNCMQPLILTVQSAVPPQAIGVATASATFFRQIGGTIGVAVFLSVLFSTVGGNISSAMKDELPKVAAQVQAGTLTPNAVDKQVLSGDSSLLAGIQKDSSVINDMSAPVAHPFKVGFADSMTHVFVMIVGIGLLAFLVLLFMPEVVLRETNAASAAAAQRAAKEAEVAGGAGHDVV